MYAPNSQVSKRRWFAGTVVGGKEGFVWRAVARRVTAKVAQCVARGARAGVYIIVAFCTIAGLATIARFDVPQDQTLEGRYYQRRAAALLQENFGAEDIGAANGLIDLAGVYQKQKRYAEAENLYDRALIILMHQLGTDNQKVMEILDRMAGLQIERGNLAMAGAVLDFARSIREYASSD